MFDVNVVIDVHPDYVWVYVPVWFVRICDTFGNKAEAFVLYIGEV